MDEILRHLPEGDRVLDVGSRSGAESLLMYPQFFVSSFVSNFSRLLVVSRSRCLLAVPQVLECLTERENILHMELDTRGFVISTSPVRSQRVAPVLKTLDGIDY